MVWLSSLVWWALVRFGALVILDGLCAGWELCV